MNNILSKIEYSNLRELSSDNTIPNILVWNPDYTIADGSIIIRTKSSKGNIYRLPIGNDIEKGIEYIRECENCQYPTFWNAEGERLDLFKKLYGNKYIFVEDRDSFDYVYDKEKLVNLQGKQYHSKRNHISSFSKRYNWKFELLDEKNIKKFRQCSDKWYSTKIISDGTTLAIEKEGIELLLNNYKKLNIIGGGIIVDDTVIAFSLGTEINPQIFDICIEKALPEYAEAYSVINREFAKRLDYKYINREEDLGIDGLRKSKLSYHPEFFVKKYFCYPKQ